MSADFADKNTGAASSPLYFPLFVNLSDKRIVVVGGGRIAARRVQSILDFAGRVAVVAPEVRPELKALAADGRIDLRLRRFQAEDLEGADLALTATGVEDVDEWVWSLCRQKGIPVNVSSDKNKCDFYFPGIARKGKLVAAVSAGGSDHTMARKVTETVRQLLDEICS